MLTEAAAKYKVATQMGNQGYSNEGTRQCAEMIWTGEIGNVTEVHAWTDRPIWPQGLTEIPAETPVPATLDWDLWLGIAEKRPFTAGGAGYPTATRRLLLSAVQLARLLRFRLRRAGRHGLPHSGRAEHGAATRRADSSVECIKKEGTSNFMFPKKSVIRFDFPARGNMPAVKLFWYDGLKETAQDSRACRKASCSAIIRRPRGRPQAARRRRARLHRCAPGGHRRRPSDRRFTSAQVYEAFERSIHRRSRENDGSLFIGDKGMITTGTYGEKTRLLPVEKMKDYRMPPPAADALARPLSRLDSRLQGRRPGMLELQRRRSVRRMDAAGRDRAPHGRQARVGSRRRCGSPTTPKPTSTSSRPSARAGRRTGRLKPAWAGTNTGSYGSCNLFAHSNGLLSAEGRMIVMLKGDDPRQNESAWPGLPCCRRLRTPRPVPAGCEIWHHLCHQLFTCFASKGLVWVSPDAGGTWTARDTAAKEALRAMTFLNANRGSCHRRCGAGDGDRRRRQDLEATADGYGQETDGRGIRRQSPDGSSAIQESFCIRRTAGIPGSRRSRALRRPSRACSSWMTSAAGPSDWAGTILLTLDGGNKWDADQDRQRHLVAQLGLFSRRSERLDCRLCRPDPAQQRWRQNLDHPDQPRQGLAHLRRFRQGQPRLDHP